MPPYALPLVTALPFVALLVAIALAPLLLPRWWHRNANKALVVVVLAAPVAVYLPHLAAEKLAEYVAFVVVIAALFVITGGIHVQGSLAGTPLANTGMLGIGALLANVIGTTGASVLLIRPLLRANRRRKRVAHIVVFFIFIVANCGGLLTPIGDPPLLLGYLKGVPFFWTLRLFPQWLALNAALLLLFNFWDEWALDKDEKELPGSQHEEVLVHEPLRVRGLVPLLALGGVVLAILLLRGAVQSLVVIALGAVGYFGASAVHRARNAFTWGPIVEVAVLFAGIFVTMAPALELLNRWAEQPGFALHTPARFFWASGALSSVLDNAPTYLAFVAAAAGLADVAPHGAYVGVLAANPVGARLLAAISTGAVFMGANTYIGNAPNFMVRAIAEENGVKMPSFHGYLVYSGAILLPLFAAIALVFFK